MRKNKTDENTVGANIYASFLTLQISIFRQCSLWNSPGPNSIIFLKKKKRQLILLPLYIMIPLHFFKYDPGFLHYV